MSLKQLRNTTMHVNINKLRMGVNGAKYIAKLESKRERANERDMCKREVNKH